MARSGAGGGSGISQEQEVKEVKDSEVDVLFPLPSIQTDAGLFALFHMQRRRC